MKEFFPVLRSSQLFSGVSEEELTAMLTCLGAEKRSFPKETFLLRSGDTAESIGLVLSGSVLVIQEDIWGNRNILSNHSRIIRNLLGELAEKNLRFGEKLTHMGQRTTRAKLMSYFSAEAQRLGTYEFDVPFSRQQLADYLAVERSGLSLELGKMKKDGLLDFHKSHFVLKV